MVVVGISLQSRVGAPKPPPPCSAGSPSPASQGRTAYEQRAVSHGSRHRRTIEDLQMLPREAGEGDRAKRGEGERRDALRSSLGPLFRAAWEPRNPLHPAPQGPPSPLRKGGSLTSIVRSLTVRDTAERSRTCKSSLAKRGRGTARSVVEGERRGALRSSLRPLFRAAWEPRNPLHPAPQGPPSPLRKGGSLTSIVRSLTLQRPHDRPGIVSRMMRGRITRRR